ncbi:MAG: KpsF/GutQ family sugar-phosphate isomerase [Planctomycetota bacterium]
MPANPTHAQMQAVLRAEAGAVCAVADLLDTQQDACTAACAALLACDGRPARLACTGIGKAGLIARKLAATAASTGTPAFYLHPADARHGDLGMLQAEDVVLALSNSGSSTEILELLPSIRRIGCPLIALVGKHDSPLAKHADLVLDIGPVTEACPLGLAPSTSTTALLALGDALLLTVQARRAFTPEDYARYHPGGALGRRLMTCAEAMRRDERVPVLPPDASLQTALRAITSARAGSCLLSDADGRLLGIFTDGDLRRVLASSDACEPVLQHRLDHYASMPCRSVRADDLLQTALHLCNRYHINELPVVDAEDRIQGLIDLQDLAHRGFEVNGRSA